MMRSTSRGRLTGQAEVPSDMYAAEFGPYFSKAESRNFMILSSSGDEFSEDAAAEDQMASLS